jgi:regulatory protein
MAPPSQSPRRTRERRAPRPLDAARLDELALAYVARFATSAAKLGDYCRRKLRERGWTGQDEGSQPPDVGALVARFVAAGYVDDAAFARARTGSLLRRGYGERRIEQALRGAGIGDEDRQGARHSQRAAREAALALLRKKGFGPFAKGELASREQRQKQLAAMLRAGHPLDIARELLNAASEEEALSWVEECDDDDQV